MYIIDADSPTACSIMRKLPSAYGRIASRSIATNIGPPS
jgi:hypothetical protein